MHVDSNDHKHASKNAMLNDLTSITELHDFSETIISKHVQNLYALVKQFNAPMSTTCCYQFIQTSVENSENVEVHCYIYPCLILVLLIIFLITGPIFSWINNIPWDVSFSHMVLMSCLSCHEFCFITFRPSILLRFADACLCSTNSAMIS
jgi:hypothetical protein